MGPPWLGGEGDPEVHVRDATSHDLTRDLLTAASPEDPAVLARRVEALTILVFDLLAEVDALRQTQATGSAYRDAYRETSVLGHNSSGVSSGWGKLLERFYPREPSADGRVWRESLMMRRLGFTRA